MDLSDSIEQAAQSPETVVVDGRTVTARPMSELIETDRYLAAKQAMQTKSKGLRFTRITFPGATH